MNAENHSKVARIAARQWGVVTRPQLRAAGVSDVVIRRALDTRTWRRLYPGVYFVGVGSLHPYGRLYAALHAVDPDGVISHGSAASVHGSLEYRGKPHITTTIKSGHRIAGIHIHRRNTLPQVIRRHGLRVTTIEQTVLDLATTAPEPTVQRVLNQALFDGIVDLDRLAEIAQGRKGARMIRSVLAHATPAQSPLEDRFYRLIKDAALPPPLAQRFIGPYRVDFHWPEHNLIVETDGWAGHGHPFARLNDARRDAYLQGLGLHTHRIPGYELEHHPYRVISELTLQLNR
jgi:very-short-patch-repair endonuclease